MHSILRFVFVVVPTAALATAVVVGVSRNGERAATVVDGDLARDLQLASTTGIELVPADQPLTTISSIESSATPRAAGRERTLSAVRSAAKPRMTRSRPRVIRQAARAPEVAEEELLVAETAETGETGETAELAGAAAEEPVEGAVPGGVALPRPTGIPVSFPPPTTEPTYDPGPTVTRGGGVYGDDHCQIGGRRGRPVYGPTIFRGPRTSRPGVRVSDRIRAAEGNGSSRPGVRDRVRVTEGGSRSRGGSVSDRIRRRG